jgi:nitrogen fixation NifU-like protein
MSDLRKLYDPVINAHQANPYHFSKIRNPSHVVKAYNPVCGDRFDFFLELKENKIDSFHFHGYGCAVSMAAGSVLVKSLEGKTVDEAMGLCTSYLDTLKGKSEPCHEEWKSFTAVRDFPSRYDCAAMAWEAVRIFLNTIRKS